MDILKFLIYFVIMIVCVLAASALVLYLVSFLPKWLAKTLVIGGVAVWVAYKVRKRQAK